MNGDRLPETKENVRSTGSAAAMLSLPGCVARTTTLPPVPVRVLPLSDAAPETSVRVTGRFAEDVAVNTTLDPATTVVDGAVSVMVWGRFVMWIVTGSVVAEPYELVATR